MAQPDETPSRPVGRPTKCTPETTERIADGVRKGLPRERAAHAVGVSTAAFYRWMADGEAQESGPYREFREAVLSAESELLSKLVAVVVNTATDPTTIADPGTRLRAATYMMSNRFPTDFTTRSEVRHQGPDGGAVKVEGDLKLTVQPLLSNEQLRELDPEKLGAVIVGLLTGTQAGG